MEQDDKERLENRNAGLRHKKKKKKEIYVGTTRKKEGLKEGKKT